MAGDCRSINLTRSYYHGLPAYSMIVCCRGYEVLNSTSACQADKCLAMPLDDGGLCWDWRDTTVLDFDIRHFHIEWT
jgi:hypothetical protein